MKYTKVIVQEDTIELTYNWNDDIKTVISTALYQNNDNVSKALKWVKELETSTTYESALRQEVYTQLMKKFPAYDEMSKSAVPKDTELDFYEVLDKLFGGALTKKMEEN